MLDLFSVSVVMIRSLAVLIIVQAIAAIPAVLRSFIATTYPEYSFSDSLDVGFFLVSYVVLATALLIFSRKLGALFTRGLETTSVQLDDGNLRVLQRVAFSVLGAYLLVYSLPSLIKMILVLVLPPIRDDDGGLFRSVNRSGMPLEEAVRICAQTLLGIFLLLGWETIVYSTRATWKKLFSAEVSGDVDPVEEP